jgi:hypothetical protein
MAFSKLNSIGYYAFKLASPDRTEIRHKKSRSARMAA